MKYLLADDNRVRVYSMVPLKLNSTGAFLKFEFFWLQLQGTVPTLVGLPKCPLHHHHCKTDSLFFLSLSLSPALLSARRAATDLYLQRILSNCRYGFQCPESLSGESITARRTKSPDNFTEAADSGLGPSSY